MTRQAAAFVVLLLGLAGCGGGGATKFTGSSPSPEAAFGSCAFCHQPIAVNMLADGADLKCQVCHDDLLPGKVGPGHRAIPGNDRVPSFVGVTHRPGAEGSFGDCAFCHNQFALTLTATHTQLKCETCHADQQPGVFGPQHRSRPGPETVPSFVGPTHQPGAEAAFGDCAFCHNQFAVNMIATSSELTCQVCHSDRQPGVFGPQHRARPGPDQVPSFGAPTHELGTEAPFGSCAFCHNQFAVNLSAVSGDLKCQVCHADRQPGVFGAQHRARPTAAMVPSFTGPDHALGVEENFGFCALCHNQQAVNMTASGVDVPCEFCHDRALSDRFEPQHRNLPGPQQVQSFPGMAHRLGAEARFGNCGFCHSELTAKAAASSGHGRRTLDCASCHIDVRPRDYGPGHRNVPACAECHDGRRTHQDPALSTASECAVCHTAHGSTNLFLVREQIVTPIGVSRDVQFTNLLGLADGSFASSAHPGSGLCEVCHTTTRFFRGDGSGDTHFPFACFPCHPHADGFSAR